MGYYLGDAIRSSYSSHWNYFVNIIWWSRGSPGAMGALAHSPSLCLTDCKKSSVTKWVDQTLVTLDHNFSYPAVWRAVKIVCLNLKGIS